ATKLSVIAGIPRGDVIPVLPVFDLCHRQNKGAAFSFLARKAGWQIWLSGRRIFRHGRGLVCGHRRRPALAGAGPLQLSGPGPGAGRRRGQPDRHPPGTWLQGATASKFCEDLENDFLKFTCL
ncbi:unnamed protein product, partial [Prorocentrum cordatum]